ncbi:MAG TPA: outer membrane beta-barrel domain-containing protein [Kofleriaceae bacterium]|nr:outer membrane beta-barrel domain-containing protein [Kofleriaceae bacterium]
MGAIPAHAEPRQNSLAGDVAVRHRRLLVKRRFEVTPLFESTVNADFRHIIGGGLKIEYHLSDMWSIGAVGVASTAINTALVNKILPSLEKTTDNATREPSQTEFKDHLNSMPLHGAAYLSFTPWYGKLAAFGQAFVAFDFYFQAGVAFAQLKSNCPTTVCSDKNPGGSTQGAGGDTIPADNNPNNDDPLNNGSRVGLYLGGGIHVFLNDFLALDLTVRDYAFTDNPSGADFNADLFVSKADNRFLHHLFFGLGLSIMLPTTVKRTP